MAEMNDLGTKEVFSKILHEKMKGINRGIEELELYEFRYALDNLYPPEGWASIKTIGKEDIETLVNQSDFYTRIQIKPRVDDRIVLDENIIRLTRILFVGLVTGEYAEGWILKHFYFDIRGFFFLHRTRYLTDKALTHFGGKPFMHFEQQQKKFECYQDIGYKDFKAANTAVDQAFIDIVMKLVASKGTPLLLAIAGPTAAGKTEIVDRLRGALELKDQKATSVELDNFLTDRDYRELKGIHSLGKEAIHVKLLQEALEGLCQGRKITIPRYDFVFATSSHDLEGNLKPDGFPLEIEPADIIFIEGNFPFLIPEIAHLIGIKVVYLTDDEIRFKRKWKRDIDYRKKYEPTYFRNRFFKEQFLMAEKCYRPQIERCDILVDTTEAAIWVIPDLTVVLTPDEHLLER